MGIVIRPMKKGEEGEIQKVGKKAFSLIEGMFIGKPKQAYVAAKDGRIVGAVIYKITTLGKKKTGYLEYGFVDPECHGQGIGGRLYEAVTKHLFNDGCQAVTAQVKDDNAPSFSLLIKNGFSRVGVLEVIRRLGIVGAAVQFFLNLFWLAIGMDFYMTVKEQSLPEKKSSVKQIFWYFASNLVLILFTVYRVADLYSFLAAFVLVLGGRIAIGGVIALTGKRKWHFRLNNGGAGIVAIVNFLSGVYPMCGNWYPDMYENTPEFRRELGMVALAEWLFILAVTAVSVRLGTVSMIFYDAAWIGGIFLIYRILAFYPFESFGGRRVLSWNKAVFGVMAGLSVLVLVV